MLSIFTLTKAINIASRMGNRTFKEFAGTENYVILDIILKFLFYFSLSFVDTLRELITRILMVELFDIIILNDLFDDHDKEFTNRYSDISTIAPFAGIILGFTTASMM